MNRRVFLQNLAGGAVALSSTAADAPAQSVEVPSYLTKCADGLAERRIAAWGSGLRMNLL